MAVRKRANGNLNGREQVGKDGDHREERFRHTKVKDHGAVQGAHQGHQGHGYCCVYKCELEAFEEHRLAGWLTHLGRLTAGKYDKQKISY